MKHRAVVEFFVEKRVALTKTYNDVVNVLGDATSSRSMDWKCTLEFRRDVDDTRSGRAKSLST